MSIRTEVLNDYEQVYELNVLAFNNREDESKLIEKIRASDAFIPHLSLVAEEEGRVVGHALFSKAEVINDVNRHEVIVLAPIAVLPEKQKKGIGGKLIHEGLQRCKALGYNFVFLIGHPSYYPKFGFKPAGAYGFELKQFQVPEEVFMVNILDKEKEIVGELRYPLSFF